MLRILTVCTGNICRSPLAEVLLRTRLSDIRLQVESVGVRAMTGRPMTAETVRLAEGLGVADEIVAGHRARQISEPVVKDADLVLAMSREHRSSIVEAVPSALRSTFTLREFARLAREASDAELLEAMGETRGSRQRVKRAAAFIAGLRGEVGPPRNPFDDDIPDPYGRGWDAYEKSASVLVPAVEEAARVIRMATGRT
ncbi:arsenate reductase/protein-tyrosine-phosphatase family protein [Microbacterium sp. NPDC055683]